MPSIGGYAMEAASVPLSFFRKSLIEVTTNCSMTDINKLIFESKFEWRT